MDNVCDAHAQVQKVTLQDVPEGLPGLEFEIRLEFQKNGMIIPPHIEAIYSLLPVEECQVEFFYQIVDSLIPDQELRNQVFEEFRTALAEYMKPVPLPLLLAAD